MTSATFAVSARKGSASAISLDQDPWIRRVVVQELAHASLEAGKHIRSTLLESMLTGQTHRLEWARASRASRVVGGTFHDVLKRPEGGVDVVCETAASHGLASTLAGALHYVEVLRAMTALGPDARPAEILALVRERLLELGELSSAPHPALLRLDGSPLTLTLANAFGVSVAIRSKDGSVFEPGTSSADEDEGDPSSAELEIALEPGDLILITTQELTKLARRRSRIFNVAGWLCECGAESPAGVVEALGAEMAGWGSPNDAPENEVTFVAIAVRANVPL